MNLVDGWTVFNDTGSNWTNTILYTSGTWSDGTALATEPPPPTPAKQRDSLDWLRDRVDEVCDLGRLDG